MVEIPRPESEIQYISGLDINGKVATGSFGAWAGDTPPNYSTAFSDAAKWGNATAGTAGGAISYFFDPASNWTATEKAAFTSVLDLWSAVANISFSLSASSGLRYNHHTRQ
jgi:hypothetical protein